MTDRPILFSAPMVRALLDGRKTQTRRLAWRDAEPNAGVPVPTLWRRVVPGDRLWVRENFAYVGGGDPGILLYEATWREDAIRAGCDQPLPDKPPKLTSCIHMPRKLSRLTLEVTASRVQRVQQITGADAEAEGVFRHIAESSIDKIFRGDRESSAILYFRRLWETLHGEASWQANPKVIALTFTVTKANIDSLARAA